LNSCSDYQGDIVEQVVVVEAWPDAGALSRSVVQEGVEGVGE
jgi:hypothetical protein